MIGLRVFTEWVQEAQACARLRQSPGGPGGEVGVGVPSPESEQGNNFPGHCPSLRAIVLLVIQHLHSSPL